MARPRTDTNVLKMRGAFRHQRGRLEARQYEPRDLPELGPCPETLGPLVQQAWHDIAVRAWWLRQPDEVVMERAAVLLAALRVGEGDGGTEKLFQNYVRMLGLPATERSKVIAPSKKPTNKYSDLA